VPTGASRASKRAKVINVVKLAVLAAISEFIIFSPSVAAQTQRENDMANAAGGYYAAIVLAKEFKGTHCGNIDIDKKWLDLDRAKKEIFSKIPKKFHKEMHDNWSSFENMAKRDVRELVTVMNSSQAVKAGCDKVREVFWTTFNTGVKRWQSF
jgi:hypothetical protein